MKYVIFFAILICHALLEPVTLHAQSCSVNLPDGNSGTMDAWVDVDYRCQLDTCSFCTPLRVDYEYIGPFDVSADRDLFSEEIAQLRIHSNLSAGPIPENPTSDAMRVVGVYFVWDWPFECTDCDQSELLNLTLSVPGDQVYFAFQEPLAYEKCLSSTTTNVEFIKDVSSPYYFPKGCSPLPNQGYHENGGLNWFFEIPRLSREGAPWITVFERLNSGQDVFLGRDFQIEASFAGSGKILSGSGSSQVYFAVTTVPQWGDLLLSAPEESSTEIGLSERGLIYLNSNDDSGEAIKDQNENDDHSKFLHAGLFIPDPLMHDLMLDDPMLLAEFPYLDQVDSQLVPLTIDLAPDWEDYMEGVRLQITPASSVARVWKFEDTNTPELDCIYDEGPQEELIINWDFNNSEDKLEFSEIVGRPNISSPDPICEYPEKRWGLPNGLFLEAIGNLDEEITVQLRGKVDGRWQTFDRVTYKTMGFNLTIGEPGSDSFELPPLDGYQVPTVSSGGGPYPLEPIDILERLVPVEVEVPLSVIHLKTNPILSLHSSSDMQWVVFRPDAEGSPDDPKYVSIASPILTEELGLPGFELVSKSYFRLVVQEGMLEDAWEPLLENLYISHLPEFGMFSLLPMDEEDSGISASIGMCGPSVIHDRKHCTGPCCNTNNPCCGSKDPCCGEGPCCGVTCDACEKCEEGTCGPRETDNWIEPNVLPVEGGVRSKASIPEPNSEPQVTVNGKPAHDVKYYENTAKDCYDIYFTLPANPAGPTTVQIDYGGSEPKVIDLEYTEDVVRGLDSTEQGLKIHFNELLTNDHSQERPEEFFDIAPTAGAIGETVIFGILYRAKAADVDPVERAAVTNRMEQMLPRLQNYINSYAINFDIGRAVIRSITHGQTLHTRFRNVNDTVLLTLGTGTLTFANTAELVAGGEIDNGEFILPADLDQQFCLYGDYYCRRFITSQGWNFWVEVDPTDKANRAGGVHIRNLEATRPDVGLQYVARDLSHPKIAVAYDEGSFSDYFELSKDYLSHIYVNSSVVAELPSSEHHHDEEEESHNSLHEWILTAVYRIPFDRSIPQENTAGPALVVRQSFAFSDPHDDYEPSHCLLGTQAYPRISFSISDPDPDQPAPNVSLIRADHRLAVAPQALNLSDPEFDEYVAGFFKDKDHVTWWLRFCDALGGCQPLPAWTNMFDPNGTIVPVKKEVIVNSTETDNIHLHHVHPVLPKLVEFFDPSPIVEAPGSFDGTIHMHWRWGDALGEDFGAGEPMMPLFQHWEIAMTKYDFPENPQPSFFEELSRRFVARGGVAAPRNIYTDEKTIWVGVVQDKLKFEQQYETLSTGFGFGIGPSSRSCWLPPVTCPILDAVNRLGGYWMIQQDWFEGIVVPLGARLLASDIRLLASIGYLQAYCWLQQPTLNQTLASEASSCEEVSLNAELINQETPFSIETSTRTIEFKAAPEENRFVVGPNMFRPSFGYLVSETGEAPGSELTIDFNTAVRHIRHLQLGTAQKEGTNEFEVEMYAGEQLVGRSSPVARVFEQGIYAESISSLDPSQSFDRIVIRSKDSEVPFALGTFKACEILPELGDLDYDADVDLDDFAILAGCSAGAGNYIGVECIDADLDADFDVDCDDVAIFDVLIGGLGELADTDMDLIPDVCDNCPSVANFNQIDCNTDGIGDACLIAEDQLFDCNLNNVLDSCEADCNFNGTHDDCDIGTGESLDCDGNGVPDECQEDCNANQVADVCELPPFGNEEDCNANSIPDMCEMDCNLNSIPDECDIDEGRLSDGNDNGLPDICEVRTKLWPNGILPKSKEVFIP